MKNNQLEHKLGSQITNLFLFVAVLTLTAFTTGCKSEGNGILGKQSITEFDEDPLLKNAPFAYDFAADTISYNSCVIGGGSAADPVGLHGLKIGASEGFVDNLGTGAVKGGIKLRSKFLQYVGTNFSPDYPSTTITPSLVMRVLNTSYSTMNSNAYLQFAVRKKSDYSVIPDLIAPIIPYQTTPSRDAAVFLQTLGSGYLGYAITKSIIFDPAGNVLAEGPRVYDLSDTQESAPIEGSINLNATTDETSAAPGFATEPYGVGESYAQRVRDSFSAGTQILTATFGGRESTQGVPAEDVINDTINNIKRPYKTGTTEFDTTKAFGRGYQLKFESQDLSSSSTWPKSRLTSVFETDLESATPVGGTSWKCEQFTIAAPAHWNNIKSSNKSWVKDSTYVEPNCAPLMAADTTCLVTDSTAVCAIKKERSEKIKRIRRHYAVDAWNVGIMFTEKLKSNYLIPMPISPSNAACNPPNVPPYPNHCYAREFDIVKDSTNAACNLPNLPPYPSVCFINKGETQLCVSPKSSNQCYLPTVGILQSGTTNPADATLDVGIQYDRTQECYQTMATISGSRDPQRKKGRCAQFASICVRTSSSY